ncbi:hypothetical protein C8Q75DRAFT_804479 [Abortiporus biennis]|nr:hypothetical protein C8Q75DRAFT_804479 [Abortiporus biennis]
MDRLIQIETKLYPNFNISDYEKEKPPPLYQPGVPICAFGFGISFKYLDYALVTTAPPLAPAFDDHFGKRHDFNHCRLAMAYIAERNNYEPMRYTWSCRDDTQAPKRLQVFAAGNNKSKCSLDAAVDPERIRNLQELLGMENVEPQWFISF